MMNSKSKLYAKTIQLYLFKVVLFFSVCAFSGFNTEFQSTYLEPIRTELIESKNYDVPSRLYKIQQNITKGISKRFLLGLSFCHYSWTILNLEHSLAVNYKSICEKLLSYEYTDIKFSIKTFPRSSKDEMLSFPLI